MSRTPHKIHTPKHPGFERVATSVANHEGVSMERARAIVASGARHASVSAKRENPALKRVKGK